MKRHRTVRQVLVAARAAIVKHGWHREVPIHTTKARCSWLAISDAAVTFQLALRAAKRLEKAMGIEEIVAWNDDPKRTKRQVLAAFDKAIKAEGRK